MRWERFFAIVILLTATAARGQSPKGADPIKAFEQVESAKSEDISPEVRATIINKPRIAEETLKRLKGLREAGNPHIQRGPGLLLPDMKDDPSISQVDLEKLREERIAMIERRAPRPSVHSSTSSLHPSDESQAGAAASAAPEKSQSYSGLLFAGASLLLTVAGGIYFWKTQRG